jgi:flagellar basal-body rod modification protein FlgD
MSVTEVTSSSGVVVGAQTSSTNELDNQDFMNLLIAQIQNQDPLSPMDNTEFQQQLTQLTTLEELQSISAALEQQMTLTQSLNNTMMVDLVGRDVTVVGNRVSVNGGETSSNVIQVDQAGAATVEVRDASGVLVDSYTVELTAGSNDVSWDGLIDGEPAEDGTYALTISAVDSAGNGVAHTALMTAPVRAIRFENNAAIVEVAGTEYYVSEIYAVSRRG